MFRVMMPVLILMVMAGAQGIAQDGDVEEGHCGRMEVIVEEGVIGELPLEHTYVEIDITGNLQRATVRQVYGNPYDDVIEAVYTFPLPQSGAVDRMVF